MFLLCWLSLSNGLREWSSLFTLLSLCVGSLNRIGQFIDPEPLIKHKNLILFNGRTGGLARNP